MTRIIVALVPSLVCFLLLAPASADRVAIAQPATDGAYRALVDDVVDDESDDEPEAAPPTAAAELSKRAISMFENLPRRRDARAERLVECESLFDEIVREHPSTPESYTSLFYRSECQRLLNEFDSAIEGFVAVKRRRLPEEDRDEWEARIDESLGLSQFAIDEWAEALESFAAVYGKHPDSDRVPSSTYHAGICLRELGKFEEAKSLWWELRRTHPQHAYTRRATNELGTLRPPLERLRPLVERYRREWDEHQKAPFQKKRDLLKKIEKTIARIGEVRCEESERFLLDLFVNSRSPLQETVVEPLLNVGGPKAAKALLDGIERRAVMLQREIFEGIQRRQMRDNSVSPVEPVVLRGAQTMATDAAIAFLGRIGTPEAARLLVAAIVEAKSDDALAPQFRTKNGSIARMLRKLRRVDSWQSIVDDVFLAKRAPLMKRRVIAEALGYSRYRDAQEALETVLAHPDSQLASTCARSLGRLKSQDSLDVIVKQLRKRRRDAEFVRAGIEALTQLDPTAAEEELLGYTGHRSVPIRTLTIRALGKIDRVDSKQSVIEALSDPAWQVRRAALQAAENYPSVALISALIQRLGKEDGALLPMIAKLLITYTGIDLGPNAEQWKEYWEVAKDNWDAEEFVGKLGRKKRKGSISFVRKADAGKADSPSYFGVEIISKRIAFIVDVSGSMSGAVRVPKEGGGTEESTKIELAKQELISAIKKLRKGTFFNIVKFGGSYTSMNDKLLKLSRKSVKRALAFARGLNAGGGTNIYDSLEFVLQSGEIDTIFLLSDGAPSAGKYTDATRILEEIARINATSQVTIHTIAVGFDSELMRRLAEQNDGNYIVVGTR